MALSLNPAELARKRGVSSKQVERWMAQGCPHKKFASQVLLNPDEVEAWLKANNLQGDGTPGPQIGGRLDPELREELLKVRLRKDAAQASKYEHQLAVARGDFVSTAQVESERLARVMEVKAALLALPGKVSTRLAHRNSEDIYIELRQEVLEILTRFAGDASVTQETPHADQAAA